VTGLDRLRDRLVAALRAHLAGAPPVVPEGGEAFWDAFVALSATRTYGFAGPNPISYTEIEAYMRIYRWPLAPHHIHVIRAMDAAWLAACMDEKASPARDVPTAPITAAAFDAVF
jgi:hypothetical protein